MRSIRGAALAALLIAGFAVPAHALNWSLGGNLGYVNYKPTDGDATGIFAWPSTPLLMTPGIRIGFMGENPIHEFHVDTGLWLTSSAGFDNRRVTFTGNYQYNWPTQGSTGLYLTAGAGAFMIGTSGTTDQSGTAALFGGGVGVRHKMGNGHGVLRGEVRFDKVGEAKDGSSILLEEGTDIEVRLGFDLWDK